jgi:PAB1-binding protein PBP1
MSDAAASIDVILEKFMREVERSVHAFYRGDVRQNTQRIKTDTFLRDARQALLAMMPDASGAAPDGAAAAAASNGPAAGSPAMMAPADAAAAMRCIMGWMPMGAPTTASPESRCVAAAREMAPTWGERDRARQALARAAS